MVEYLGVLDVDHFHAVVRSALRAHGFSLPSATVKNLAAQHCAIGGNFIDDILPGCWPRYVDEQDLERLREVDPLLWERLPAMAALGWAQTGVFLSLATDDGEREATAVLALGAAFNVAIGVIDYVVDECPDGSGFFKLLSEDTIRGIFDLSSNSEATLGRRYRAAADPRVKLIFVLVGTCARVGRELCRLSGRKEAWSALASVVGRLLEAERVTSLATRETVTAAHHKLLASAMEDKSILPSVAILYIALLGAPDAAPTDALVGAAATLGQIFWRIDDLADLLTDCRRRVPSAAVVRLQEQVVSQHRAVAADADLYDITDQAAREVVALLDPVTFAGVAGWPGEPRALGSLVEFARLYVGGWVAWQEEAPLPRERRRANPAVRTAATDALNSLLKDQQAGFPDAVHNLWFPRADLRYEMHQAMLSFRAVALDALLDARDIGLPVPESALHSEALQVLRAKHRLVRGGWSYMPEVPELPPDADDNGQVLQVLSRLGGQRLAATCEEPVRMLLDTARPDGGVLTWVIDPRGDTPADEAVRRYLGVMGGWGVHPEVVANFAYGLFLYGSTRFDEPLQRIAAYLEAVQENDGSWTSKWYEGPYYGTFRAATVLARLRPHSDCIARSRSFILEAQSQGGGWGPRDGEPLSTALAVLALDELGLSGGAAFARGVDNLVEAGRSAPCWPASPWIRFPTVDGEVIYGSRTMTNAFCLKALAAAARSTAYS